MSQGADGRRSWGQEAAELAVPTCPASSITLTVLLLASAQCSGSPNIPKASLALELPPPALTRRVVLKQFSLGSPRLI